LIWSHEAGPEGAPLVVLVHGAMDRSAGMLKVSRQLDDSFRVARFDRRGYGRSKPSDGPFSMDAQVDDLREVLAGRRALVFGHSYGGNVALGLAARHPELARAVAVYEVPLSWMGWWPGYSRRNPGNLQGTAADAAERFMRRMIGNARWDSLSARTRDDRRAEGDAFVGELTDLAAGPPWADAQIDVPFVAMYGELAREHHRDSSHLLAELLSGPTPAPAIEIAGAAHNGPFTHAGPVAAVIRDLARRAP